MVSSHLDLLQNLIRFSHALRINEVTVTTDRVLVALNGLRCIDIRQKEDFYDLLKASFVSRREDVKCFDELFKEFWSQADVTMPLAGEAVQAGPKVSDKDVNFRNREREVDAQERAKAEEHDILPDCSSEEILIRKDFSSLQAEELEQVRNYVMELSRKMASALSRRVKQGKRKRSLDFRRTIRHSVRQGGEILELRWKQAKPKPLRIVFLCDVSGSMDTYGQFILFFMYAIQYFYPYCETFAFGTRLTRVTEIFQKEKTFEKVLQFLSRELLDWSGGTNIGGALHQLRRCYPGLLRSNRTIFLLFSDGWEKGDTSLLEAEMKCLKQRTKKLIWLNPHLKNPGYQPLCKGMTTALPYVDNFLPCHDFSSLRHIGNLMAKI